MPSQYGAVLSTDTMEFQWNLSLLVKYLPLREATWITLTRLVATHDSRIHDCMVTLLILMKKAIYVFNIVSIIF